MTDTAHRGPETRTICEYCEAILIERDGELRCPHCLPASHTAVGWTTVAPTPTGPDTLYATRWNWLASAMAEQAANHQSDDYRRLARYVVKCMEDTESHFPAPPGDAETEDVNLIPEPQIVGILLNLAGQLNRHNDSLKYDEADKRFRVNAGGGSMSAGAALRYIAARLRSTPEAEESEEGTDGND